MKKIFVGLLTLGAVLVVIPMFAAFEAHVINVTARIENALAVSTKALDFGTVFPQEHLDKNLTVLLSGSFLEADRVDDVEYIIRQKPKCAIVTPDGQSFDAANTATGHVVPTPDNPDTTDVDESQGGTAYTIDCGPAPIEVPAGTIWGPLPSLCEYISKEGPDANDGDTPSFHKPFTVVGSTVNWLDTHGRLAKSDTDNEDTDPRDTTDNWIIDLAVPCFGGYCAQDWADFVHGVNPQADPAQYTQPIDNEHKIFGCDLWVEVAGVSETES